MRNPLTVRHERRVRMRGVGVREEGQRVDQRAACRCAVLLGIERDGCIAREVEPLRAQHGRDGREHALHRRRHHFEVELGAHSGSVRSRSQRLTVRGGMSNTAAQK